MLGDKTENGANLFLSQNFQEVLSFPFLGGEACVFTTRSPDKETPNEDAAALIPFDERSGVLVVADGVGGFRLGDKASASTLQSLRKALRKSAQEDHMLRTAVLNGIEQANKAVLDLGVGAATTLALVEVQGTRARTYHVGDSMVCVVGQRGKLKLQTVSHSPVGFAVEAGVLDEKEAMHHEDRHLVSNILGTPEMRIEIGSSFKLAKHDTVVIGSDGLFDNLHLSEIIDIARKGPLDAAVRKLAFVSANRMQAPDGEHPSKADDMTIVAFRRSPKR